MSDVELAYAVGQTVEVTAIDVAQGGWCVARPEGLPVLFVRHALPGERVLARVTEVTSRFARADAIEIREASPDRVEPPCPNAHPGGCGGCDWQHASLPAQRALKARRHRPAAAPGGRARARRRDHGRGAAGRRGPPPSPPPPRAGQPARLAHPGSVRGPPGRPGRARAHRSHEVVDIGDCPIAHPAIRDLGLLDYSWEGAGTVEAAAGSADGPEQGPPGPRCHPHQGGPRAREAAGPPVRPPASGCGTR